MANSKKIIISFRTGRLANRLILFANAIALAEECGWQVSNVAFHSYAEFFKTTRSDIYCRYPVAKKSSRFDMIPGLAGILRKTRILNHVFRFAARQHRRIPFLKNSAILLCEMPGDIGSNLERESFENQTGGARIIFINTWKFRAPKLVERHAQKIRDYFSPIESLERASREAVEPLRRNSDIVVGVHIRHGDYRRWKGGKYFFATERYAAWMRELASHFPGRKVAFLVCSDEPRTTEEFSGLAVGFGTKSPVSDLNALSQCDYIFGAKSTFSQWASFYGGKPLLHLYSADDEVKPEKFHISYLGWG